MRQERSARDRPLVPVPSKPVDLLAPVASDRTYDQQNARFRAAAGIDAVDACSEMFKFCKQCDEKYLQPCNIQCLFDVDSGFMHRGALSVVCDVVDVLLAEIAQSGVCHSGGAFTHRNAQAPTGRVDPRSY